MCLRERDDVLSNSITSEGRWRECEALPELWRRDLRGPSNQSDAVFVDIGANLGACTLQVLLTTNARAIVFEPNPASLFFLTETLHRAAREYERRRVAEGIWSSPSLPFRERVVVLPFAVGEEVSHSSATLYVARGNAGNSVVGKPTADHEGQDIVLSD
jgi:hypothetical protein